MTPTHQQLIDFAVREARALDEKRFDEWNALFTDDGMYWVPLTPGQPDGIAHLAPERGQAAARHPHRTAEEPACVLATATEPGPPPAADPDGGSLRRGGERYIVRCEFHYAEAQNDEMNHFVGTAFYELTVVSGELRMRLKRVNLINSDAALPAVQLFI